jgi:polyhydroxyalkanoate synthesis regulator phasin
MAKTIGALSVGMSLSVGDFISNMSKAQKKVSDFGDNVTKSTSSISKNVTNLITLSNFGNKFVSSAEKATSAIKYVYGAAAAGLAAYGVYKFYDRAIEAFKKTEDVMVRIRGLSENIGAEKISSVLEDISSKGRIAIDVSGGLAAKMLAAGINSDSTARMLESFGQSAKAAGSGASEVFTKLGEISLALMSTGEVNAQSFAELASMGLPVYEALAQRLSSVTGEAISAERAMAMLAGGQVSGTNALNALVGLSGNDKVKAQAEAQANTLSGIYAQLAGEIEGFFATMGGAIAEALDLKGFNQVLIDFIQSLKTNFDSSLRPAIENIGIALAAVRDVLFAAFRGLVDFFARFGETDGMIQDRVSSVRSAVVSFAQSVVAVFAQFADMATKAIQELVNLAGGAKLLGKFAAAGAAGAGAGAAVGSVLPGIGTGIGAGVGFLSGVLGVSMSNERFGENADFSAVRANMEKMFQGINDTIGQVGSDAAANYLKGFITGLQNSFENKKDNLEKALSIDMKGFFVNLQSGIASGEIGYTTFLSQLANGTASAIAIFKRQMELGNMSTDQFQESIGELETRALKTLDIALKEGKITNEEYGASIERLYKQLDSLKPPEDIIAPTIPTKLPDWIQQLTEKKSPLDTYREKLAELENALNTGQILPDAFAEGATMLADELERAVGSVEALKNPGALLAGSREAFSQVLKIQNQGSGENPQQRLARLAERANELAQQQARTQEQILAATLNNNPIVTATFGG